MSLFRGMQLPEDPDKKILEDDEERVLEKVADKIVEKSMTVPAIMFLESVKPLNYIGAQALIFFEPIVQTVFNFRDYDTFRCALEKRETLEILIQKIEAKDAVAVSREKRIKKYLKEQKKHWRWYQRYLGIGQPKVDIPEEILNPPDSEKSPN